MAPSLLSLRDTTQRHQSSGGAARKGEGQVRAIVLTEWHVLVLRKDRVTAYSRMTEELVWDERITLVRCLLFALMARADVLSFILSDDRMILPST
jgi:hypothetical protein